MMDTSININRIVSMLSWSIPLLGAVIIGFGV